MKRRWKACELIALIEDDGWFFVRIVGDHRHFRHPVKPGTTTVPGKLSDVLPIGTTHSIFRQAGIKMPKC